MTETNRQRAESAIDVAYDSTAENASVQAQLATAHALLAVADELAALRNEVVLTIKQKRTVLGGNTPPTSCWSWPDTGGHCTAHGEHPHKGMTCLDCSSCKDDQPAASAPPTDSYAADIAHVEETGLPATALRAARAAEGGDHRG